MLSLADDVTKVKGVGKASAEKLSKLGISTVSDLIRHFPRDYDKYGEITRISDLRDGEKFVIFCTPVKDVQVKYFSRKNSEHLLVKDSSGMIEIIWFNMPFLKNVFHLGAKYIFRGDVSYFNGRLVMRQPKSIALKEYDKNKNKLIPIYSLTAGVTNNFLKKSIDNALMNVKIEDRLDAKIIKKYGLTDLDTAIRIIHNPKDEEEYQKVRNRLAFDEFYEFLKGICELKKMKHSIPNKFEFKDFTYCDKLIESLEYKLTDGQENAWTDIKKDLSSEFSMNRLIQGDVGCGKTVVALLTMLAAVNNGYQAAIMVPTQVLAMQHYESITEMLDLCFGKNKIRTALLDGNLTAKNKRETYAEIENGNYDIIIGTHALFSEGVVYKNLAVVITDEQHRFGVRQREKLKDKGDNVHVLVMSATPIPRTLSLLIYGDLDISVIKTMPLNRKPIKNCVVGTGYRKKAYEFIEKEVKEGHQAYVVCPMVKESEEEDFVNCVDYTETLRQNLPISVRVEYVHGQMKSSEKDDVLKRFANGDLDVLVSTTVIEVGINVPNATVMFIENAERFGLATLHQLRGRVGRSALQSYTIFMYNNSSQKVKERLNVLYESNDGFFIANEDLKQRGPGDVLGTLQSGELPFKVGDIYADSKLLLAAKEAVDRECE